MAESYSRTRHPLLRKPMRNDAVARMQSRLTKHNTQLDENSFVDGAFGPNTEREVKKFQQAKGLKQDGIVGENTWKALLADPQEKTQQTGNTASNADRRSQTDGSTNVPEIDRVKRALQNKGYQFFDDDQPYYLNIIGVRSPSTEINHFDDEMYLIYRDQDKQFKCHKFPITTDPGSTYTQQELLNKDGAAILQPGQYTDVYAIDSHRGKYQALCQRNGKVKVWRDGNKDGKLDRSGRTYEGYFGINIHRSSSTESTYVGAYSAGCQVFKRAADFSLLMDLANRSKGTRGNKFTYTLLEQGDI
ncbi:peptidoglycan-binding protein [Paraneptunicella aestuarii]|uniref:peptidoglycan-binding domain-containing protein n=1 Tax=Paraneptunicella aestuarii TaxID=2831148 RepID=UPI001E454133|nr:peptidoglycan-binding protein [Paraneptunicella aestuarii]UAA37541.1 peptidoglycan-binding protein [Paraneptunicella aestuarii]